jgi:hypothetical protein
MRTALGFAIIVFIPLAVLAAESKPKPDDVVNNPPFAHWSSFPTGTSVTQKETVSLPDGSKVEELTTAKLIEKSKDKVVVETTITTTGNAASETSTTVTTFPPKVKMRDVNTPADQMASITEGKEELEFKGKKVNAEWVEAVSQSGDEVTTEKVWTARDVPGGLIKQTIVHKKGDKVLSESIREVVEVKVGS